jgi:hypothetical protein
MHEHGTREHNIWRYLIQAAAYPPVLVRLEAGAELDGEDAQVDEARDEVWEVWGSWEAVCRTSRRVRLPS